MIKLSQSPTEAAFVQDPYPFYDAARRQGSVHYWEDYDMHAAFSYATVSMLLKDRRLGREAPPDLAKPPAPHTKAFYEIEAHSMLELEPPRHTRLRGLVMRAFTSRRIQNLEPEIDALCRDLCATFPDQPFDLLEHYATKVPVIIIARMLGVPEDMCDQLLRWSNAMVAMYQASRTYDTEVAAAKASSEFSAFMRDYIEMRRASPADDLLTELIAAEEDGERLTTDEMISTCILLLNAGHEATVHTIGNAVKTLLESGADLTCLSPERIQTTVEELIRFDPPLHMFTRYAYEPVEVGGITLQPGDQIALLLGAANRDPGMWEDAHVFNPNRVIKTNMAFGAGRHFCIGAPLARLELQVALSVLFECCPNLKLTESPTYANVYHFHGLTRLMVSR
ncbi:cytochrome P450 [Cognatishimia maritima]|nr:cytochrome P450 [Cognatishimia maritima]